MRRKTEDRRLSFVKAAGVLFVEQGFGAVTMEAIALRAGASKATLYSYFSSKEALFETFVHEAGKGGLEELEAAKQYGPVREILHRLGMAYLNLVTRSDVIEVNRLIMGEAGRHPQLSRIFYENGPRKTLIIICETIELLMDRGELRCTDIRQAGLYFKALCEAGLVERQLWGLDQAPDTAIRRAAVEDATNVYLRAFAVHETLPLAK
ncbi:TetR family transcriptional regulator [Prodigiosinella confusarubida]|uniref:TetR family transcriptional regulator n=1 Tax=Serratia sp. (strain ATCC 39006) TaxID=104623 RepID=A0A2I5TAF4_SERS3|nr:TetR/AcrR family transcriptional regulator [Serratia sp. ATCC 39006]AUH01531.1 TetR family transcriptional regulator [Serratia sp. ATCC 39006]AUH05854.1 TetR family transcriptional regulator [Serratia sp. ATCC 39006]